MKIALCLSGQARSVKKGFEYVKRNLLDINDVTVFCHVWESPNIGEIELYKPEMLLIQKSLTNDLSKYTRVPPATANWKIKDPARAAWNLMYSIKCCNDLKTSYEKEHNIKFDWVVRSRYDFALNTILPFNELDKNKLYIPNCRMTPKRDFGNDQFAFSSSINMDKYADGFNHIEKHYDSGTVMIGEEMMAANWRVQGLVGENLVYFNPNHAFPPGPHNGTWHSLIRDDFEQWTQS